MRIVIILFILLGAASPVFAEEYNIIEAPETIEEAKDLGKQVGEQLPGEMEKVFKGEVMPLWTKMLEWAQDMWNQYVTGWIDQVVETIQGVIGREVEKRTPDIQEEFEKEKEELKQDIQGEAQKATKGLWKHLMSLIFEKGEE